MAGHKNLYFLVAVLLGILASVLLVLSVAVFEGYIPTTFVDNLTYGELGTFAFLAIVGAIGMGYLERAEP
jgi:uncharacterized membrane protein YGL010W